MKFRQRLKKNKALQFMASLNWTVLCLGLLFILTLWGTIAQVQTGLYLAQERYFHSFYFLIFGFIPFPGAQFVMWILFVNLISAGLIRYVYTWPKIGIHIIHSGLVLFLISGYITLHRAQNSHLTLKEGESRNVSTAFNIWEVALWEHTDEQEETRAFHRNITAVDIMLFNKEKVYLFDSPKFTLHLKEYYRNCAAYKVDDIINKPINASGIHKLKPLGLEVQPENNTPGAVFQVSADSLDPFDLLLFGDENKPTPIKIGQKQYNIILRLKHYALPFSIKLIDFIM